MLKKVTYVLAGVLAAAVLVAGVATAAYADDGKGAAKGPWGGRMLERVAQIVNIDQQKLADAFKQAGSEMRQEGINDRFAKWVSEGKLTQEQADQYKAWLAARPNGAFMGPKVMDKLLADGKIDQAQYDVTKAWWDKKPNIELPKPQKPDNAPPHGFNHNRSGKAPCNSQ